MNNEICLKLKNAGFPYTRMGRVAVRIKEAGTEWFEPTLEELIEACGEEFVLEKVNSGGLHQWTAGTFIDRNGEIERAFTAETSYEAVVKLWLALNKK